MMATKNIRGLLVTNAFLKNGKFVEHYEWLREAARQQEIRLDLCDNAMLHAIYGMESDEAKLASYSFIIFWDKDWATCSTSGTSSARLCPKATPAFSASCPN